MIRHKITTLIFSKPFTSYVSWVPSVWPVWWPLNKALTRMTSRQLIHLVEDFINGLCLCEYRSSFLESGLCLSAGGVHWSSMNWSDSMGQVKMDLLKITSLSGGLSNTTSPWFLSFHPKGVGFTGGWRTNGGIFPCICFCGRSLFLHLRRGFESDICETISEYWTILSLILHFFCVSV